MGASEPRWIAGRYAVFDEIAAGGMATVHLGRLLGPAGFARIVAVKRLHPHLARDPEFVSMFLDEARLAARVRHPNVVSTLDVIETDGELFIVMDYVEGATLSGLRRAAKERGSKLPVAVTATIAVGVLHGLHAAHEARAEDGAPLGLIHRDVSPQNVLVGIDGVARVVDFGVAKAAGRLQTTREGVVKGKFAYMAPEQLQHAAVDRRADVYATAIVLWETLTGERLFVGDNDIRVASQVIEHGVSRPPSALNAEVPAALDQIVLRGASRDPDARFATAMEMADAIESVSPIVSPRVVGRSVSELAGDELQRRARIVSAVESRPSALEPADPATVRLDAEITESAEPESPATSAETRETERAAMTVRRPFGPADAAASPATGISQVSSWTSTRTPARRKAIAWLAAISAVTVALLAWRMSDRSVPSSTKAEDPDRLATQDAAPLPSAVGQPPDAAAAAAPPMDAAPHSSATRAPARSKKSPTKQPRPAPTAKQPGCDPYYFDEQGRRRFNPACVK